MKTNKTYWIKLISVVAGVTLGAVVCFPLWKRVYSVLGQLKSNEELMISYYKGMEDMNEHWKQMLLKMEYAEYDRKKGFWKLLTLQELADMGAILGKGTPIPVEDPLSKKK